MYGGITLAVPGEDGSVTLRRFRVPEAWIPVLFIAGQQSRTAEMRAALPSAVPHAVAARQAGRSALLATAVLTSDAGMLAEAMRDGLHQPFRLPHLPGAAQLIELAYERGAAGACLSGAGPSVLAICDSRSARIGREGVERRRAGGHGHPPALRYPRRSPGQRAPRPGTL